MAEPPTLLFLGDSLTAGYGVRRDEGFVAVIETRLKKEYSDLRVINGAESGSLSSSALSKLKFYSARMKPDLLVLTLGGNDAREGKPLSEIEANLTAALRYAQDNKIKTVFVGMRIFPNLGPQYASDFEKIYPKLAKEFHVTFVPFLLAGVAGLKELNQADGFHPNAKGHQKIADTLYPVLRKEIRP